MHILVTNDDGPPSPASSPYVLTLVRTLQAAGHTVSVVLPHTQRSWIGKAHIVGQAIKPTYYRPRTGTTHERPLKSGGGGKGAGRSGAMGGDGRAVNGDSITNGVVSAAQGVSTGAASTSASEDEEEWVLIDSTPASCVQIGLHHFFASRGPVALVLSGPNYGRNTTALFALSSGTLGGALEGAVCGVPAIALSYAFFDRNHDADIIAEASRLSVRVADWLVRHWGEGVGLYSVNVPLVRGVEGRKVCWTRVLQNAWTGGSCFEEVAVEGESVEDEEGEGPQEREADIRREESRGQQQHQHQQQQQQQQRAGVEASGAGPTNRGQSTHARHTHKHFKWAPRFKDVYDSVENSGPGNDGWAVKEGFTSVTALRANFMHAEGFEGELKL
ncbi:hypothetical protein B0A49_00106 [Cryomyces minteri]|uniref:Survival protein SurE-like phosphatase/nucleotidase domain-containing protein n=1 Tax=Cryomyces minteri TaxID=331657 RepID=A0A4U0Y481_9PEZI|nr:hypothetical protein B0A49_00106 [Cryomyces minteri]